MRAQQGLLSRVPGAECSRVVGGQHLLTLLNDLYSSDLFSLDVTPDPVPHNVGVTGVVDQRDLAVDGRLLGVWTNVDTVVSKDSQNLASFIIG